MKSIRYFCLFVMLILSLASMLPAQSRTSASATTSGTRTATSATQGNRDSATQEIDVSAGTSENVNREFGTGFVGRSDNADRFVGNAQAGPQQNFFQNPNFSQRNTQNVQGGQTGRSSQVRPQLRLGFSPQDINSNSTLSVNGNNILQQKLSQQLLTKEPFSGLQLEVLPQGEIIIQGTVKSERDRRLAEAYLRLEPGISKIENHVIVLQTP